MNILHILSLALIFIFVGLVYSLLYGFKFLALFNTALFLLLILRYRKVRRYLPKAQ